jgi:hypothetical protein
MNLVKAQEYAQALPLAELQKYANGLDPDMLPAWLATAEIQAKEKRSQMANNLRGAAQGPQPSIKEQIEQKAGLMAAQQPGMTPGAPQMQPQAPPTMMAAHGGLTRLPSHFNFDGGGIVAFAGPTGSDVSDPLADDEDLPMYARISRKKKRDARDAAIADRERNMAIVNADNENTRIPAMQNDPRALRAPPEESVGTLAAPAPAPAPAPRPPGLPGALPQQGPRPSAAPAALAALAAPAGPPPDSAQAMAMRALKEQATPMTQDAAIAERRAGEKAFGLDKPAGEDQMARIDALNKKYESSKPTGLQELIQMLGQSSQYKGMSGMAPAYTAMEAQKRAANLAHAKEINTLMSGVEGTRRGESTAGLTGAGTTLEKNREQTNTLNKERMQSLAAMAGNETHERSSRYTADMHYKEAMAQMANANARQDVQEKRLLLDSFKTRIASIDKELQPLLKMPFGPAKTQIAELQAEKAGLTKALDETSGISKIPGAPGAGSPGGTSSTPPPGAVREVKR